MAMWALHWTTEKEHCEQVMKREEVTIRRIWQGGKSGQERTHICHTTLQRTIMEDSTNFQADQYTTGEEAAAKKASRSFKKYQYRGVELDQLLDLSNEKFIDVSVLSIRKACAYLFLLATPTTSIKPHYYSTRFLPLIPNHPSPSLNSSFTPEPEEGSSEDLSESPWV